MEFFVGCAFTLCSFHFIFLFGIIEQGGTIVVLSNRGKEEMEAELIATLSDEDLMGTEVGGGWSRY